MPAHCSEPGGLSLLHSPHGLPGSSVRVRPGVRTPCWQRWWLPRPGKVSTVAPSWGVGALRWRCGAAPVHPWCRCSWPIGARRQLRGQIGAAGPAVGHAGRAAVQSGQVAASEPGGMPCPGAMPAIRLSRIWPSLVARSPSSRPRMAPSASLGTSGTRPPVRCRRLLMSKPLTALRAGSHTGTAPRACGRPGCGTGCCAAATARAGSASWAPSTASWTRAWPWSS